MPQLCIFLYKHGVLVALVEVNKKIQMDDFFLNFQVWSKAWNSTQMVACSLIYLWWTYFPSQSPCTTALDATWGSFRHVHDCQSGYFPRQDTVRHDSMFDWDDVDACRFREEGTYCWCRLQKRLPLLPIKCWGESAMWRRVVGGEVQVPTWCWLIGHS